MDTHTPVWALAIFYWLHMAATAIWIGGVAAFALIIQPILRKTLSSDLYSRVMADGHRILLRVGWMSLMVLGATGFFQMGASVYYQGFIQINNPWAEAIFLKHMVVILMVFSTAYGTFVVQPALERGNLVKLLNPAAVQDQHIGLEKRQMILLWINFGIALLVLLLTAVARVS
jgi:uncharacterized membrane protein